MGWTSFKVLEDDTIYEQMRTGWRKVEEPQLHALILSRARAA